MKDKIKYTDILILEYFYETKENYILSDIMKKLGMDYKSFNDLISDMINNELLEYNNSLLTITKKGIDKIDILYGNNSFIMKNTIDKKNNDYIPNNFLEKI